MSAKRKAVSSRDGFGDDFGCKGDIAEGQVQGIDAIAQVDRGREMIGEGGALHVDGEA
jgi:hypothetical protein